MGIFRQFPYSNFHEMNMDEMIKIFKNMLEEWAQYHAEWETWKNQMNDDWSNYQEVMNTAWQNLQNFINNYFDNLDVQEEINNKIVSMVASGEFGEIVRPFIPAPVSAWLTKHITQPTGVVIDTSLSVAGACADAKATGDRIRNTRDRIRNLESDFGYIVGEADLLFNASWTDGYHIPADGVPVALENYKYSSLIPVDEKIYNIALNAGAVQNTIRFHGYDSKGTWVKQIDYWTIYPTDGLRVISIPCSGVTYMRISVSKANTLISLHDKISISDSIDNIEDYTNQVSVYSEMLSWEIGSIYGLDGKNYNTDIAIRTPNDSRIVLPSNIKIFTDNPLITVLYAFKYNKASGEYVERIGGETEIALDGGYSYRFVAIGAGESITSETIDQYINGINVCGATISDVLKKVAFNKSYAHLVSGKEIDVSAQGFNIKNADFSLPSPADIAEGLTSRQDFDIYNGVMFQLYSYDYVALIDMETGSLIAAYHLDCGHANSCQFSNEFYDPSDVYPLLYCFKYYDTKVCVNRVTNSGATLIKTYKLNIENERISGGLDVTNNRIIAIGYTQDSSTDPTNNSCVISVWDLDNVTTDSGDNTLVPALIKKTEIPFIPVIQGCTFFKDTFYIASGYYPTYGYEVKIIRIDNDGNVITEIDDFPTSIKNDEAEGICFYKNGNKYDCYFTTTNLYQLDFS